MSITAFLADVKTAAIKVGEKLPLKQAVSRCGEMGQVPASEIKWLTSNGQPPDRAPRRLHTGSTRPPCAPAVTCQHPTCPAHLRRSEVGLQPRVLQGPKRQVQRHQR